MSVLSPSIAEILNGLISKDIEITVFGWVRTRRDSKANISFISLYDGSCLDSLQIIVSTTLKNYKSEVLQLTSGCSIKVTGTIVNSIGSKQSIELVAMNLEVLGWVEQPNTYPITTKKHTVEYLRSVAHLRPRTHIFGAITRIRHVLSQSIHNFMCNKGFIWIPTPIITSSDTEGNSKMFHISSDKSNCKQAPCNLQNQENNIKQFFFGKKVFLTVSGQLNVEAYASALSKVYTFGPTFRAEYSDTSRHLAEFWMVEPEIAFSNLNDIMILSENLLKDIVNTLLSKSYNDILYCNNYTNNNLINRLKKFVNSKFVHIEYTDAIHLLQKHNKNFKNSVNWGIDFFAEHEKYLSEQYFKSPVIIINHPKHIKAFYMRLNEDNKTVSSMDVLLPTIGEIIGGSQREERISILDKRLLEKKLPIQYYWWYRDLRKYGTVPHSGFGLGLERFMLYVTGMHNIRDVIPFPRSFRKIDF